MWSSTQRAVLMGLLVLPDEQLDVHARIDGCVLRFNPNARRLGPKVHALLDALPGEHPRCRALVELVEANRRAQAALVAWSPSKGTSTATTSTRKAA